MGAACSCLQPQAEDVAVHNVQPRPGPPAHIPQKQTEQRPGALPSLTVKHPIDAAATAAAAAAEPAVKREEGSPRVEEAILAAHPGDAIAEQEQPAALPTDGLNLRTALEDSISNEAEHAGAAPVCEEVLAPIGLEEVQPVIPSCASAVDAAATVAVADAPATTAEAATKVEPGDEDGEQQQQETCATAEQEVAHQEECEQGKGEEAAKEQVDEAAAWATPTPSKAKRSAAASPSPSPAKFLGATTPPLKSKWRSLGKAQRVPAGADHQDKEEDKEGPSAEKEKEAVQHPTPERAAERMTGNKRESRSSSAGGAQKATSSGFNTHVTPALAMRSPAGKAAGLFGEPPALPKRRRTARSPARATAAAKTAGAAAAVAAAAAAASPSCSASSGASPRLSGTGGAPDSRAPVDTPPQEGPAAAAAAAAAWNAPLSGESSARVMSPKGSQHLPADVEFTAAPGAGAPSEQEKEPADGLAGAPGEQAGEAATPRGGSPLVDGVETCPEGIAIGPLAEAASGMVLAAQAAVREEGEAVVEETP